MAAAPRTPSRGAAPVKRCNWEYAVEICVVSAFLLFLCVYCVNGCGFDVFCECVVYVFECLYFVFVRFVCVLEVVAVCEVCVLLLMFVICLLFVMFFVLYVCSVCLFVVFLPLRFLMCVQLLMLARFTVLRLLMFLYDLLFMCAFSGV